MRRTYRALALGFCVVLGLSGCGKEAPTGGGGGGGSAASSAMPSELGRLVPADAIAIVYAPSLGHLEGRAMEVAALFSPEGAPPQPMHLAEMLADMVGPETAAQVDASRPLAIALSLRAAPGGDPSAPQPLPTFIVPLKAGSPQAAAAPGAGPPLVRVGDYVGASPIEGYAASAAPASMATGLPGGDLVIRLDLAKAYAAAKPMLEEFLGGAGAGAGDPADPKAAAAQMLGSLQGEFASFLEGTERLDLAVRFVQGRLDLDVSLAMKVGDKTFEGIASTAEAAPLARAWDRPFPIEAVYALRADAMMKLMEPLMKANAKMLPPEAQGSYEKLIEVQMASMASLGETAAFGMGFGPEGMEGVVVMSLADPAAYNKAMETTLAQTATMEQMGTTITPLPPTQVGGVEVRGWTMKFDMEKLGAAQGAAGGPAGARAAEASAALLGKDGMKMRFAVLADRVVMTLNGDDALLARALAGSKGGSPLPDGIRRALDRGTSKPLLAMHMDLRGFIAPMLATMRTAMGSDGAQVPEIPDGPPIPCLLNVGIVGRTLRCAMSLDLTGVAALGKSMQGQPSKGRVEVSPR